MAAVALTPELKAEYRHLFDTCAVRPAHAAELDADVAKILANRARYEKVATALHIPWFAIAVIHSMEASLRFDCHLHNGDPLTGRTIHVPPGRPKTGHPPFTWEESAIDALTLEGFPNWHDWSLPGLLFKLEGYNGFGYRQHHADVPTPYLWSYSNHYTKGKYGSDGHFDPNLVSQQCGAAVLLHALAAKGAVTFGGTPQPGPAGPALRYSPGTRLPHADELQRLLNEFAGNALDVDGCPGKDTSDAFKRVFGRYLAGDPRATA